MNTVVVPTWELFRETRMSGGFTWGHSGKVADGFSVSVYPEVSQVIHFSEFNSRTIEEYTVKNAALLMNPNAALGGWHDKETDNVWLDVVVIEHDEETAVKLAIENNQIAIFDLSTGTEIPTGGTGEVPAGA